MKLGIKIIAYGLAAVGLVLLLFPIGWFPSFYDVRYMGWAALAEGMLIIFLPLILKAPPIASQADQKNQAANLFQILLAVVFAANALGDLGLYQLYKVGIEYDKILHFFIPLFSVVIIAIVAHQRFGIRPAPAALIAGATVVACSIAWELCEYLADHYLKTHISGVYGLDISNDTKMDLFCDCLGALSGVFVSYRTFTPARKH